MIGNALNSFADKKGYSLKSKESKKDSTKYNLTPYADQERKNIHLLTQNLKQ